MSLAAHERSQPIASLDLVLQPNQETSPCPSSETGVTTSVVSAGAALATSALTGAEPWAAASFRAISSTALFGEGVRGCILPTEPLISAGPALMPWPSLAHSSLAVS